MDDVEMDTIDYHVPFKINQITPIVRSNELQNWSVIMHHDSPSGEKEQKQEIGGQKQFMNQYTSTSPNLFNSPASMLQEKKRIRSSTFEGCNIDQEIKRLRLGTEQVEQTKLRNPQASGGFDADMYHLMPKNVDLESSGAPAHISLSSTLHTQSTNYPPPMNIDYRFVNSILRRVHFEKISRKEGYRH
mmetsp:Transcript_1100/g.1443  ORF Transcript_1100/g.1443 Transcript_1100/m.1443 type:complete len:188 (+) Transcript_1100:162-725(+)